MGRRRRRRWGTFVGLSHGGDRAETRLSSADAAIGSAMPLAGRRLSALPSRVRLVADSCAPGRGGARLMATTLDQVTPGRTCRIDSLTGAASLVQRLLELGMMEGEQVTVVNKAPLGDPIEVECALTRLSLRKSEAAQIQVNLPD